MNTTKISRFAVAALLTTGVTAGAAYAGLDEEMLQLGENACEKQNATAEYLLEMSEGADDMELIRLLAKGSMELAFQENNMSEESARFGREMSGRMHDRILRERGAYSLSENFDACMEDFEELVLEMLN